MSREAMVPLPDRSEPAHAALPYPVVLLRMLAVSGYGLWLLQGAGLTLGVYRDGRSESLLPLSLGCVLISLHLLAACLPMWPWLDWHGWRPDQGRRPTREAMLAFFTYLPMLAVAGLVRGSNDFWATRLAGMALLICSLSSLAYTARGERGRPRDRPHRLAGTLPLNRVVSACYAGGLWLWLCVCLQDDGSRAGMHPWILMLLMFALLLGLVEVLRWQSLQGSAAGNPAAQAIRPARFVASLLTYVVPCAALLVNDLATPSALLTTLAALSCVVGKSIEQRVYDLALGRLDAHSAG